MYRFIVARIVTVVFERLGRGDYELALSLASDDLVHTFAGHHCLSGTRRSVPRMRQWFQRLFRLFPTLRFELHSVQVTGWPWDTTCVAQWTDRGVAADGVDYINRGVHVIRLRWGRLKELHAHLDTQVLTQTLTRLAMNGHAESKAAPIVG